MTSPSDSRPAAAPRAAAASHVDSNFERARELCRRTVAATPELSYVGHYTDGAFDFSYDRLADGGSGQGATEYERIGVQMTGAVREFDRMLRDVKCGALIRTVVHTGQGMLICDSGRTGEHVVAFTHDPAALPVDTDGALSRLPGARAADQAIGRLVTDLRAQVSLGSQNPGSWISPKPGDPDAPAGGAGPGLVTVPHVEGGDHAWFTELVLGQVSPLDLHLLAHCRNCQVEFAADQLAEPGLGPFFHEISVAERRIFYRNLCGQLPMMVRKIGRMTASVLGGKVERFVLDVEQGAVYYYRVRPGDYLVGVTLDQGRVADTEDKVAELARQLRATAPDPANGR